MQKLGIQAKLIATFSLLMLVAIIVAGTSFIISARKAAKNEVNSKVQLLNEAKGGQIYAYLDSIESRTIDFASDGFIRDNLREIINTGSETAAGDLSEYLIKNRMSLDPFIIGILITDINGKVVAATGRNEIGVEEAGDMYFTEGKEGVYVMEVLNHEHFGRINTFAGSAPITDKNTGELLGVIINIFRPEKIEDIVSGEFQIQKGAISSGHGLTESLTVYLVNKEKYVMANSRQEERKAVGVIDTLPVRECLENQKQIVGEYVNHFGNDVIGSSMCIPGKNWVVLTEIDAGEAFGFLNDLIFGLLITLFSILLFIVLVIYLISKNITSPIEKLRKATDVVSQGDLDMIVSINTKDEIEELADSFNKMSASLKKSKIELQEYSKGLEHMVEQKTVDLQGKVGDLEEAQAAVLNIAEDAEDERNKTAREKERIDAILHSIGDGVFVVDAKSNIMLMNKVAEDLSGYKIEEARGHYYGDIFKFVYEKDNMTYRKIVEKVLATGLREFMAEKVLLVRRDKSKINVNDSAAPIKDESGATIGVVVVFRDNTRERALEKAKDEFMSVASHQLRTPLGSMRWYLEMILAGDMGKINRKVKEALKQAYESDTRMIGLVKDLLNIARIEQGSIKNEPEEIDIVKMLEESIREISSEAKNKKVTIDFHPEKGIGLKVWADPKKIREALQNILSNGVKYNKKGGKLAIDISEKNKKAAISFIDTGIGISAEDQNKIFSKFFRAPNAVLSQADGTGLGLFVVKAYIEEQGGSVSFASEEGKGSTFHVELPMRKN